MYKQITGVSEATTRQNIVQSKQAFLRYLEGLKQSRQALS